MAIYDDTIGHLIDEIHKFKPDWIITKDASPETRPPLPFFYYSLRPNYERITFNDVDGEPFVFYIQLTAVTGDQITTADLSHDMRMLLRSWGVIADLAELGISIPSVRDLEQVDINFGISYESESKLLVKILANDTYDDTTQSGYIENVSLETNTTNLKEENNE